MPTRLLILFFLCVVGFVVLFIAYDLVFVEPVTRDNLQLQAFPRVRPQDLPDASISLSPCTTELRSCTSDYDCETCDDAGKFKCTEVQRDGQFEINGIKAPKGKFCLPRTDTAKKCNRYTGKWVWTTASDCPPDENGVFSSQCWKCTCLYPDLFYDETDCSTQVACINTSDKTLQSPEDQRKRNRLRGAPYAEYAGLYWDPSAIDAAGNPALETNPYATDAKGRPKFYCECDARDARNQPEFLTLPNDPYTCHVDMCFNVNQKLGTTFSCKNSAKQSCNPFETPENCSCSCNCELNSNVTRPDGTCQVVQGMCAPGVINDTYTGCNCGFFTKQTCRSNQKNQTNQSLPACKDPENPFGEQCIDPCAGNPCSTGTCFLTTANPRGYFCKCTGPPISDAEGKQVTWDMVNKQDGNCNDLCSWGGTIRYKQSGAQQTNSIACTDTPSKDVDKRNVLKCCVTDRYIIEWDNRWGNSTICPQQLPYAKVRCLTEAESTTLKVGDRSVNSNDTWNLNRDRVRDWGWIVVSSKDINFTCDNRISATEGCAKDLAALYKSMSGTYKLCCRNEVQHSAV